MLNILKCMAVNPTCQVVPKVATAELQDLPSPSLSLEHVEHLGGGEVTWGGGERAGEGEPRWGCTV